MNVGVGTTATVQRPHRQRRSASSAASATLAEQDQATCGSRSKIGKRSFTQATEARLLRLTSQRKSSYTETDGQQPRAIKTTLSTLNSRLPRRDPPLRSPRCDPSPTLSKTTSLRCAAVHVYSCMNARAAVLHSALCDSAACASVVGPQHAVDPPRAQRPTPLGPTPCADLGPRARAPHERLTSGRPGRVRGAPRRSSPAKRAHPSRAGNRASPTRSRR